MEIRNMAQGGTTTYIASLLMDEWMDVHQTDLIIWEFLVNDDADGGGEEEQVRKLDLWLTRVHAHFDGRRSASCSDQAKY